MSTTIYNGVCFGPGKTLNDVMAWVQNARPQVRDLIVQNDIKKIFKQAVRQFDQLTLQQMGWELRSDGFSKLPPTETLGNETALYTGMTEIRDEIRDDKKEGRPGDTQATMNLFVHDNMVYGIFHFDGFLHPWIEERMGVEFQDFSYWNNTDGPENVSEHEWERREKVWDEIFADSWNPSEVGLNVDFVLQYSLSRSLNRFYDEVRAGRADQYNETLQPFLDLEKRARACAFCVVNAPWEREIYAQGAPHTGALISHISKLEAGDNEMFNEASAFWQEFVFDKELSVGKLLTPYKDFAEGFEKQRQEIYQRGAPSSLHTPSFDQAMLHHNVPDEGKPSAAKPKF